MPISPGLGRLLPAAQESARAKANQNGIRQAFMKTSVFFGADSTRSRPFVSSRLRATFLLYLGAMRPWDWDSLSAEQRLWSTLSAVGLQAGSLHTQYLIKVELAQANLCGVRLAQRDLEAADLRAARLDFADLRKAVV